MRWAMCVAVSVMAVSVVHAALPASDQASDAAYNSGWTNQSAGGTGWSGGWSLNTSGASAGHFIGSSQNNGSNDGNIDSSGEAWGLWANSGNSASATRSFNGLLTSGQSFSIDMDNGFLDDGAWVGFELSKGGEPGTFSPFSFGFAGGGTNYTFTTGSFISTQTFNTGVPFTSAGLHVEFTQGSGTSFTLAITPNGGSTTVINGTDSGGIGIFPGQVTLYNNNAGSGGTRDAFFNNLAVVPEPTSCALLAGALAVLLARRRKG